MGKDGGLCQRSVVPDRQQSGLLMKPMVGDLREGLRQAVGENETTLESLRLCSIGRFATEAGA